MRMLKNIDKIRPDEIFNSNLASKTNGSNESEYFISRKDNSPQNDKYEDFGGYTNEEFKSKVRKYMISDHQNS